MITKFQGDIKIRHNKKKILQKFCLNKMTEAERGAEVQSIQLVEKYKKEEKKLYREIQKLISEQAHERINFTPFEDDLKDKIAEL